MKKILPLFCLLIIAVMLVCFSSCGSVSGFAKPLYYREILPPESIAPEVVLKEGEEPEIVFVEEEAHNNPRTIEWNRKLMGMENIIYNDNIEDVVFTYMQEKLYKIVGRSSFKDDKFALFASYRKKIKTDLTNLCKEHNATLAIWSDFGKVVGQSISSAHSVTTYNRALNAYTTTTYGGDIYDRTLYTYTAYLLAPYSENEKSAWRLGIEARDLTADDRKTLKQNTGVLVDLVFKDYPAYFANIASGDVITKFNGSVISSLDEYQKIEQSLEHGSRVNITFVRNGNERTVTANIK